MEPWLGPVGSPLLGGDPDPKAPRPVKTEFSVPPRAPKVKIFFLQKEKLRLKEVPGILLKVTHPEKSQVQKPQ